MTRPVFVQQGRGGPVERGVRLQIGAQPFRVRGRVGRSLGHQLVNQRFECGDHFGLDRILVGFGRAAGLGAPEQGQRDQGQRDVGAHGLGRHG